jgi:hypothetical protein
MLKCQQNLALVLLKRTTDDDATSWLAGMLILVFVGLIVAGVIGWGEVKAWIELLLGQK